MSSSPPVKEEGKPAHQPRPASHRQGKEREQDLPAPPPLCPGKKGREKKGGQLRQVPTPGGGEKGWDNPTTVYSSSIRREGRTDVTFTVYLFQKRLRLPSTTPTRRRPSSRQQKGKSATNLHCPCQEEEKLHHHREGGERDGREVPILFLTEKKGGRVILTTTLSPIPEDGGQSPLTTREKKEEKDAGKIPAISGEEKARRFLPLTSLSSAR